MKRFFYLFIYLFVSSRVRSRWIHSPPRRTASPPASGPICPGKARTWRLWATAFWSTRLRCRRSAPRSCTAWRPGWPWVVRKNWTRRRRRYRRCPRRPAPSRPPRAPPSCPCSRCCCCCCSRYCSCSGSGSCSCSCRRRRCSGRWTTNARRRCVPRPCLRRRRRRHLHRRYCLRKPNGQTIYST